MSVVKPVRFFGVVCTKHSGLSGERYCANGRCVGCAREASNKCRKAYYELNAEKIKSGERERYRKNSDRLKVLKKKWYEDNKEYASAKSVEYEKNRKIVDPMYALTRRLRDRIRKALKNGGHVKRFKTIDILGCDWFTAKTHLESKFVDGMCWENRVLWHIDHIVPLALAKTEEELINLCHYTNLQPLWARDNIVKGSRQVTPV